MAKKYNWLSGETKEQLIKRLFPEYQLNKHSKSKKKLPFYLKKANKGRKITITPLKSNDFNTLELIENVLNKGIKTTLNPEWGEELVKAVKNGEFQDLKSLKVFLRHCPFSRGFWNNFKLIYKLLEKRLIFLSKTTSYYRKDFSAEVKAIVKSLTIIFHRLENKSRWSEYAGPYFSSRYKSDYCDDPCETWEGGIRFTPDSINLNGKNIDTLKVSEEIIFSQKGIRNVEVFKSRAWTSPLGLQFPEKLSALVLYDKKFNRQVFESYLEKRKHEEYDHSESFLPLPESVHYFEHDSYSENPWTSRRACHDYSSYWESMNHEELYADFRSFIPTSKPSVKTIRYMRRRFRRLLRNLQTTNTGLYLSLCIEFFKLQDYLQKDSISSQWLLTEILFGNDKSIKQRSHGRGNMSFPLDYNDSRPYSEAPCYFRYNLRDFPELEDLIKKGKQPLLIAEFLVQISLSHDEYHLKTETFNRYLQSSSKALVNFAFKQLQLKPERTYKIQPASVARGLVTLSAEEAEKYFESILSNQLKSFPEDWKQRFAFEMDDALYSQQKDLVANVLTQKTLTLGLLSLQFPWIGRKKAKYSDPKLFSWKSDRMASVWGKSNWSRPNTSLVNLGKIGWPHAIIDKALLGYNSKPDGLDFLKYFNQANTQRLLGLLNLKLPAYRCNGCSVTFTADPRIENCRTCKQSLRPLRRPEAELIGTAPVWLKKEILMYLLSHLKDIEKPELINEIETLINLDLLSKDSVLLEEAISNKQFKLSSEQMAYMLIGISDENWNEKLDRGKLVPDEFLKSEPFWSHLWEKMGEEQDARIRESVNIRFFTNPEILNAITANFEPKVLDGLSGEQVEFIDLFLREKPESFNIESTLLMRAATSSDSRVYEKAFSHLKDIGMQSKFALGLLESDFPRAIEEATRFFKELDRSSPEFLEDLISLCDSPNLSARSLGLEILETNQDALPLARIMVSLKENRHPDIRHFVASKLSENSELSPNSLDFDISVLKSRNVERSTKELVKERLQRSMPPNLDVLNESFLKTLREISQGLVVKDKEWAIKQLTRIKAKGRKVPDLQIKEIEE